MSSNVSSEIKMAFEEYSKKQRIRLNKIACWCVFFAMPAGITEDLAWNHDFGIHFFKYRLFSSFVSLIIFGLFYTSLGVRYQRILGLILPITCQAVISARIYLSDGADSRSYAGLNVVLISFCLLLPWTFKETLGISITTITLYVTACVMNGAGLAGGIFPSNLYFLSVTATFAVVGAYFTSQLRFREFATRYELDQSRRQLEESNRKLVELDQMKSRFFANISHELRTPLTLLIAPLESLRAQAHLFDETTRETLRTMQVNAMRLLKLINDLLDLVKLESGRMEIRKEPTAVEEFFRGLVQSVQGVAKDKRVRLSLRVEQGLGSLMVDKDKLEKVILNLLFNSVKFTPAGGMVELNALAEGKNLVLKVMDTGMGISERDIPYIFDRFWQADGSAQRKYQGTGIGLALVKELTEAQGGVVEAVSQLEKGTTITVKIPLERTNEASVPVSTGPDEYKQTQAESEEWLVKLYRRAEMFPSMTSLVDTLRPDQFGKGKKPKVLVADDEPDMLRFLKSQLEKHYEVLEAVDGNQALEKTRQFLPDLVLLDMMMPEKDGIETCREIKANHVTQAIPVILLTARADDETKMSALNAGASDFLTKPYSTTELHVRVKNLVESHQFQRDLARQKSALESALEQLKETEGQLVQNEKMASLGRLSAGIIHEINNPLNYANSALHVLKMKKDRLPREEQEKYEEVVSDIEEGIGRVQRIVSDLRTFTHPKFGGAVDLVELEETVSTALRFLSHELKDKIKVDLKIPKDQAVLADRNKLVHVFVNLFQNAVDALNEKKFSGEEPLLSIQSREVDGKVLVSIRDNGAGISPGNLDKIFDPFFTTKDVGQGMGLGLSLCYRLLGDQGGGIAVQSEQGKFTEFNLEIPTKK
jgi:signal transduction histidine kinase